MTASVYLPSRGRADEFARVPPRAKGRQRGEFQALHVLRTLVECVPGSNETTHLRSKNAVTRSSPVVPTM